MKRKKLYVAMRLQRWNGLTAHIPSSVGIEPLDGSEGMLLVYSSLKKLRLAEPKGTKYLSIRTSETP